ncbi:YtjB family periplasmic protein [Photobacterium sp. Alg240-V54]|uniref:YtjB family periplasmic protein n=1 Tax=Photobacterium sp. Alg240-V54 TaxID=2305995 RepID=UPI0013D5BD12|nr:AhpA/YtjB family protein [Photobacterium sp. Alg240-V54]
MIQWNTKRWQRQRLHKAVIVLICLLTFIGILQYGASLSQQNYQLLSEQTQTLSQIIVRQAAQNAALDIENKDQDQLQLLVQNLATEPLILDASIYNLEGVVLAKTKAAMPLEQLTGLSTPLAMASIGRQQIAEPVLLNDHIIGFMRITLEHDKLLTHAYAKMATMTAIIRGLVIAALILGGLLMLVFSRQHYQGHFPFLRNQP